MGSLIILLFSLQDISKCGDINEKTCKFDKKSFDEATSDTICQNNLLHMAYN